MRWRDAESCREQLLRVAIAPAQKIHNVERVDFTEQRRVGVLGRASHRRLEQRQRFEACGQFRRMIGDFADADDDGNAVVGDTGRVIRHSCFSPFQKAQTSS
jgi:hypothetical protein